MAMITTQIARSQRLGAGSPGIVADGSACTEGESIFAVKEALASALQRASVKQRKAKLVVWISERFGRRAGTGFESASLMSNQGGYI